MPTQKNSASWDLQLGFNLAFKRLNINYVKLYLSEWVVDYLLYRQGCSKCQTLNKQQGTIKFKIKDLLEATIQVKVSEIIIKKDRPCTYKRDIEAHLQNHCCSGKATNILRVSVALIIHNLKCMPHIIFSPVACLSLPYFSTLSH